jgi:hypothetical protein
MLAFRQAPAMVSAIPDRFRGTTQRWTVDAGPLAGTAFDYAFNEDWSLTWRVVTGPAQGQTGRARRFHTQPIRAQLFLVSFPVADDVVVTASVDFASRRFVGYEAGAGSCRTIGGGFRVL